jgi:hypothetical protein
VAVPHLASGERENYGLQSANFAGSDCLNDRSPNAPESAGAFAV